MAHHSCTWRHVRAQCLAAVTGSVSERDPRWSPGQQATSALLGQTALMAALIRWRRGLLVEEVTCRICCAAVSR